jgi:adenosylhomocysteine nucleosidase
MKILILEDTPGKLKDITNEISAFQHLFKLNITTVSTLQEATKRIYEEKFDFIILDLMVPLRNGSMPVDITDEILPILVDSESNRSTPSIAFTSFDDLVDEKIHEFSRAGINLVNYGKDDAWKRSLAMSLGRLQSRNLFDFVVICALEKERQAFRDAGYQLAEPVDLQGLDCAIMEIGGLKGVCIKPPRPGLVDAGIISARAILAFNPSLLCMSGICAGVPNESNLGTLVVPDVCWEYQTGKWTPEGFKAEPYSIQLQSDVRMKLSQFIGREETLNLVKKGLFPPKDTITGFVMGPMSSGSAVIADGDKMKEIGGQHRKMAGLEMEMYSVFQAAHLSASTLKFFGVKAVVDAGNAQKDDAVHAYGALISARFCAMAIELLLKV